MADKTPEELAAELAAAEAAAAQAAAEAAKGKARVLHDHDGHKVNEVVTGALAKRAVKEGWADGHPDAVAYAEKLAARAAAAAEEQD